MPDKKVPPRDKDGRPTGVPGGTGDFDRFGKSGKSDARGVDQDASKGRSGKRGLGFDPTRTRAPDTAGNVLSEILRFGRSHPLMENELNVVGEILRQIASSPVKTLSARQPIYPDPAKSIVITAGGGRALVEVPYEDGGVARRNITDRNVTPTNNYFSGFNLVKVVNSTYSVVLRSSKIYCTNIESLEPKRPVGRPSRPLAELRRPDLPSSAEENRSKKLLGVRLNYNLVEAVNQAAKAEGKTVSDWVADALQSHLKKPKPPTP